MEQVTEQPNKTVPKFNTGDKVRVMNTPDMQGRGLANKHGVVFLTWETMGVQICRVSFDDKEAETISAPHLMRRA